MTPPLPPDEPTRIRTLHEYDILDTPPEEAFEDLVQIAAQVCGTPIALISLVDSARQWFKSRIGLEAVACAREISFCAHAILQPAVVLEVPDARADPRFADNPLVTSEPFIRFYAGAPLVAPNGTVLGAICVIDPKPRRLEPGQLESLRCLSRHVMASLELRRQTRILARTMEERAREQDLLRGQLEQIRAGKVETERLLTLEHQSRRALLSVLEDERDAGRKLRESEERFRQAQKMEALGTLSGGIAHDFNNILGAIFGSSHLLRLDLAPSHPGVESLDAIEKAAYRARDLVRQILAFSRQQPHERRTLSLAPVVQEVAALLRAALPAEVELVVRVAPDAPPVFADATQVHQVLLNLCTNAWQALASGCGRIEIRLGSAWVDQDDDRAEPRLLPGRYACLSIADNGHGMDTATLGRIFEPFFTTKPPGQGTGLGLAVVHGILQAHEGSVRVNSQPGTGTCFQLYFPAVDSEPEEPVVKGTDPHRGAGQRILFVDDEPALVNVGTRLLDRLGYRTEGFTQAGRCLDAIRIDPLRYQLIITDVHMPAMSGLEFVRRVREIRPEVPVVLLSGNITGPMSAEVHRLGSARLLHKPSTLQELGDCISELLSKAPAQP